MWGWLRRMAGTIRQETLRASAPAPESDDWVLLQALRQARYSLFAADATEPGVGVHARDLLRDDPLVIVDVGFSRSASVGTVLAARTVSPDGISMTTGGGSSGRTVIPG